MTSLDLLILLGVGIGLARGFWTGAVRQVASLVGVLLAFVFAVQLMQPVGRLAAGAIGFSDAIAPVVGFLLVFVLILIGVYVLARLLEHAIGALGLGIINRIAGSAFGGLKAALLLSVCFLVLSAFAVPEAETRRTSEFYRPVAGLLPRTWEFVAERWPRMQRLSVVFDIPSLGDAGDASG